jgi:hypothetical protein
MPMTMQALRLHGDSPRGVEVGRRAVHGLVLQRKCACGESGHGSGQCEDCRKKKPGTLQRAVVGHPPTGGVPPIVHDVLRSPGQPLDLATRAYMEPRFGHDFSRVRVHTDAVASASARAMDALAYTVGSDVVFGTDGYAPTTPLGRALLAHEFTHVVQQRGTPERSARTAVSLAPPESRYESEAEEVSRRVAVGRPASIDRGTGDSAVLARQAIRPALNAPKGEPSRRPPRSPRPSRPERSTMTKRQVRRDDYLRGLAERPSFALERWRKLRSGEGTVVVTYMSLYYGLVFARRFLDATSRHPRPESVITVTNLPQDTPESLRARGYHRLVGAGLPIPQIWVHPSGNEVWVLSSSRSAPVTAAEESERGGEEDPAIAEAKAYADDFTADRDRLVDQLTDLRNHVGSPEYATLNQQYFQSFNEWQSQLNLILEERIRDFEAEVDAGSQPGLQEAIRQLRGLVRWKLEEWPKSVSGLPSP